MNTNRAHVFNKKIVNLFDQKGQALITLLFFMIIGITITSAAVVMILVNSLSGAKLQQGEIAYHIAKSGAENGVLRLLRNPSYTGEDDLGIGGGLVDITVSGSGPYTITSTGTTGNFTRKVETTVTYVNNLLTVTSQKEIY
ncbi:MAG: hypothetical protein H0W89_03035 [Candidatus Levybacteria bacterium]|nr:hypothetical protein [Candidatus Levybacteria bacterium]